VALVHELTNEQIARAQRLHDHLNQWKTVDNALRTLAVRLPGFDSAAALLKVVAINSLYGTNLYAVVRMGGHIQEIMAETNVSDAKISLVERIADLPPSKPNEQKRHHLSFASKFAHFFINPEKFPILDSYAEKMLRKHLGKSGASPLGQSRYSAYASGLAKLKELSGWTGTYRELDHYLWLAGTYYTWRKNPKAQINSELQQFFANPGDAETDLLGLLSPSMK
jgi:hypothetical protein